jgi:monovalent cation/hydrogen antiporter
MHVLQGEALLNDASGLVCMRFAVAAALTGTFSLPAALSSFAWMAGVGLAVGAGVTWGVAKLVSWGATRAGEDGGAQILITLLIPFGVYLLAEKLHGSGILAAVAAGVTMSLTDLWPWHADTRLRRGAVWDLVQLAANGSVFVLLGEQLPALLAAAPQTVQSSGHASLWWLALDMVVIVAALGALRFVWVWLSLKLSFGGPQPDAAQASSGGRVVMVMSLAGVRGAVTLAGVMTLPHLGADGLPFPARDLAILLAAGVIVLSLVLATVAMPVALRGLVLPPEATHRAAEDRVRRAAAEVAMLAVEQAALALAGEAAPARQVASASARVLALYRERLDRGAPTATQGRGDRIERQLRRVGLEAERAEVQRAGPAEGLTESAQRRIVRELDLLEARHAD